MKDQDLKNNEIVRLGNEIIEDLKNKNNTPITVIGETRDKDEILSLIESMENNSGHSVVFSMMCEDPVGAIDRLIKQYQDYSPKKMYKRED